jgi:hypothetical protein
MKTAVARQGFLLLVLGGLLAQGCAAIPPDLPRIDQRGGRVLVVGRAVSDEDRVIAEAAAERLAAALRARSETVLARDFLREAEARSAFGAVRLVTRLQRGIWPTPDEGHDVREEFRVATVLTVEVTSYEQVWGKYAKFTRVTVSVEALEVPSWAVIWRLQRAAEVEKKRGRAFQYAMERVVGELADAINPDFGFSITEIWRSWRR